MALTGVLTGEDIDQIGFAFDKVTRHDAEALVAAVDEGRVPDPEDMSYALGLAAEIFAETGELDLALVTAERAASRSDAQTVSHVQYVRTLFMAGRDDEAMAILTGLRHLMTSERQAPSLVAEALEEFGRVELAVAWLTSAAQTLIDGHLSPGAERGTHDDPGLLLAEIVQVRHRIREDNELPHDKLDELAHSLPPVHRGFDDAPPITLFWPAAEFARLQREWPELASTFEDSWEEYRTMVQRELALLDRAGVIGLGLVLGSVPDLADFVRDTEVDRDDPETMDGYEERRIIDGPTIPWPPERNAACWCGSGIKYKKCCLLRSRA